MSEQQNNQNDQNETNTTKKEIHVNTTVVIGAACIVIGIAALGASFLLNRNVTNLVNAQEQQTQLSSEVLAAATSESAATPESANYVSSIDTANMDITANGGYFAVSPDSYIVLTQNDTSVAIPASAFSTDGEDVSVVYSSTQSSAEVNDYLVRVSESMSDIETATAFDKDSERVFAGSKPISNNCVLTVAYTTDDDTYSNENILDILHQAKILNGPLEVSMFGGKVQEAYTQDFAFNSEVAQFTCGEDTVYVSAFNGSLQGADFDKQIQLTDSASASYGDIVDSETGLSPYIVSYNDSNYKMLATDADVLVDMFE